MSKSIRMFMLFENVRQFSDEYPFLSVKHVNVCLYRMRLIISISSFVILTLSTDTDFVCGSLKYLYLYVQTGNIQSMYAVFLRQKTATRITMQSTIRIFFIIRYTSYFLNIRNRCLSLFTVSDSASYLNMNQCFLLRILLVCVLAYQESGLKIFIGKPKR